MKYLLLLCFCFSAMATTQAVKKDEFVDVLMTTNKGDIKLRLNKAKAPITVANFLSYVDKKFYDGLIFHRVIKGFMIQGGGFDQKVVKKQTMAPIKNEAHNRLSNATGTISMARTSVIDSATSQFFINTVDNANLDYVSDQNYGYAVFGQVVEGMSVVKMIEAAQTKRMGMHANFPVDLVIIKSIKRL